MIYSVFLMDLNKAGSLLVNYSPAHPSFTDKFDDILQFAHSARVNG